MRKFFVAICLAAFCTVSFVGCNPVGKGGANSTSTSANSTTMSANSTSMSANSTTTSVEITLDDANSTTAAE